MIKEEKKIAAEKEKTKKTTGEKPSGDKKTQEKPAVSLATPKKRSQLRKHVPRAQVYIVCSYNNTFITITDLSGNVLAWSSSGSLGFKGPKKSTPFAATLVAQKIIEKTARFGLKEVQIYIKGVGGGREASVRAFGNAGLIISLIKDITPVPHNGCRAKKPRRV
ncbi:MAG: 30S ribosomal protein S11 [Candidatus Moranbacteria bacterium]|nr:30S ribosomal protein S11 [Candidatus Moranbacteria bacterium]